MWSSTCPTNRTSRRQSSSRAPTLATSNVPGGLCSDDWRLYGWGIIDDAARPTSSPVREDQPSASHLKERNPLGRIAEGTGNPHALFGAATVFLNVVHVGHHASPHIAPKSNSTCGVSLGSRLSHGIHVFFCRPAQGVLSWLWRLAIVNCDLERVPGNDPVSALYCLHPAGENIGRSIRTQPSDRDHVVPQNRFAAPIFVIRFCIESAHAASRRALI